MATTSHLKLNLPPALTITVCGGGNGGHATAAYLGSKPGIFVNVLTRRPEAWSKEIIMTTKDCPWEAKGDIKGYLKTVTSDPKEVIPESDIILILSPAQSHRPILSKIAPHLKKGVVLGSLFCQGGFDWAVRACLKDQMHLLDGFFGLMNIPWLCNAPEYGKRVRLIGPKKVLKLAASPISHAKHYSLLVASLFDIPCVEVPNFLTLTLVPSNQIIHPARYYGIFGDWDGKKVYKENEVQWGLYTGFCDKSAEWLQKLDDELQLIKKELQKRLPDVDLSMVIPIGERIVDQYGEDVKNRESLKMIFQSNAGYAGCRTPALPKDGGFIPNTNSRLFWEDVPFGLVILHNIAEMVGVKTPSIDFLIRWHQQFMGKEYLLADGTLNPELIEGTGAPAAYGIKEVKDLASQ